MDNLSDFELCNKTWKVISNKYGTSPSATDFTKFEQVVVLVWTVTGIIENGGFRYLFESELNGDRDFRLSMQAFNLIGCDEISKIISNILERMRLVGDTSKTNAENFEILSSEERDQSDEQFWAEIDNINMHLADFIRNNETE